MTWTLAAAAVGAWWCCLALVLVVGRPRTGRPSGAGPPPPATLALLVPPDGRVPRRAASATLLDLADRGLVELTHGAGTTWARPGRPPGDLRPFERLVLDHVVERAGGAGPVPLDVLRLETAAAAAAWHETFAAAVLADAEEQGLVRARAGRPVRVLLAVLLVVPAAVAGLAVVRQLGQPAAWALLAAPIAYGVQALALDRMGRRVPTAEGRRQVARADVGKPGFAMALGRDADLPLEPEAGDLAWSTEGGAWHQVRVVDPRGLFAGTDPAVALWCLPGAVIFFGVYAYLGVALAGDLGPLAGTVGWLVWAGGVWLVGTPVVAGLHDLAARPRTVEGQVVRLEARNVGDRDDPVTFHVAIDDGTGAPAVRFRIDGSAAARLRRGQRASVTYTPRLRYVRAVVAGPPQRETARPEMSAPDSSAETATGSSGG